MSEIEIRKFNFKKYNFQKFLSKIILNTPKVNNNFNKKLKKINLKKLEEKVFSLKSNKKFNDLYKKFIREEIKSFFNYEICYQKFPSIRIYPSNNPSKIIPFHTDHWYNHSKNETNFWLPFHKVNSSESLQIIGLKKSIELEKIILKKKLNLAQINNLLKKYHKPIKCDYGSYAVFSPFHIHGNVLNETPHLRISMDFRIAKLDSKFNNKRLGGYFEFL